MSLALIILITAYQMNASAFRVNLVTNTETCQERVVHFRNRYVFQGEAAILKCPSFNYLNLDFATATQLGMNLTWYWNDSLKVETHFRITKEEKSLCFFPTSLEDSGRYSCILRNSSFCIEVSMSLVVYERKLSALQDLAYRQTAPLSATGQLVCPDLDDFTNKQSLDLKWYKDSVSLSYHGEKIKYISGTTRLFIQNVSPADVGYYTCELTVTYANAHYKVSRVIFLSVTEQQHNVPVIIYPTGNPIEAAPGSKLIIPCKAFTGFGLNPFADMWWLADNTFIEEFFKDGRVREGEPRVSNEDDAYYIEVELIFDEFREEDMGTDFKCVVRSGDISQETVAPIKQAATSFAWYMVVVTAVGLTFLIMLGFCTYKYRKARDHDAYMLAKS